MKKLLKLIVLGIIGLIFYFSCEQLEKTIKKDLSNNTELLIVNDTKDTIITFLTLGSDTNYVTNVKGIFGILDSGLQGSFLLLPFDTVSFTSPNGKGFGGNISFGTPPMNCPPSTSFPEGINIFEFSLNNNFPSIQDAQETIDISCVSGVNSKIKCKIDSLGGWNAGNGIDSFPYFENTFLYDNVGRIGVYPVGCDSCSKSYEPPICDNPLKPSQPQSANICNIQRDASKNGGKVYVIFRGYLKGEPTIKIK